MVNNKKIIKKVSEFISIALDNGINLSQSDVENYREQEELIQTRKEYIFNPHYIW